MGSYNLLNEKWIKVLDTDGQSREVSLKELIGQAHRFSWFAGEIKHQDAAMMRMTLALCLAVFYRYDENGGEWQLDSSWEESGYFALSDSRELIWHDDNAEHGGESAFIK